ncbi:MAG TPA: YceI family protein [Gemmatimonadales bacterium]|nr:YceI family protein [Gemmatimonadales bacterium]
MSLFEARLTACLFLAAGIQAPLTAQRPWPSAEVRRGTLSFDGKSSLGDFTGTTSELRGQMTGGSALADVRGYVQAPVTTLKTGNDRRDRDLVKTMAADQFPNIRFELNGVTQEWERGDSTGVLLLGNFVIHGVTRAEKVKATVVREGDGVHLTASLPMNLHDYKVDKLTRFLVLKMDPDIVVHVDIVF